VIGKLLATCIGPPDCQQENATLRNKTQAATVSPFGGSCGPNRM